MCTLTCLVLIMLPVQMESETPPVKVYLNTDPPGKGTAFYSWINKADMYKIINKNPKIRTSIYPDISAVYIEGSVLLPIETKNSFTGWVEGSRIVRITIDKYRILVEVPPDIPITISLNN